MDKHPTNNKARAYVFLLGLGLRIKLGGPRPPPPPPPTSLMKVVRKFKKMSKMKQKSMPTFHAHVFLTGAGAGKQSCRTCKAAQSARKQWNLRRHRVSACTFKV